MSRNKMRGTRRVALPTSDRILLRHIESRFPIRYLARADVETVAQALRDYYPGFYCRVKRPALIRRVRGVLDMVLRMERKGGDDNEEEKRDRRSGSSSTSSISTSTSTSTSTSSSSSEDVDVMFDAKVDTDFDITKVLLRDKYKKLNASPSSGSNQDKKQMEIDTSGEPDLKTTTMSLPGVSRVIEKPTPVIADVVTGGRRGSDESDKGKEGMNEGPRFRDFGGIKDIIDGLINEVIVPLCHPQLPALLGVRPITGILFHGPPGCGKTSLAHAIARETELPFYKISAADIVSGISGESEGNIHKLFSKAHRTAPSIIFIDEIDAIASKRENMQKDMERRIVSQLLICMDELNQMPRSGSNSDSSEKKLGYVLVIGATNRPDAVDRALRRPGRFDREIALGVPDENARQTILSLLIKKLRIDGSVDLQRIAKSTPGFVGSDLKALVNKAGNLAMKRIIDRRMIEAPTQTIENDRKIDLWKQPWTPEDLSNLHMIMSDFEEAAKLVQPSLRREGFSSIPNVKWDDVGGLSELRKKIVRCIIQNIKIPQVYEEYGVKSQTGFLMYGPPGCGKTLIAKAVANESGANFIHIKGPELLNKFVGESEKAVRTVFSNARTCKPCIIFFDEIDALTTKRGKDVGSVCLLNQLLEELDGSDELCGVYVIGATNRVDVIDQAILRPGRLGKVVYVPLPNAEERVSILKTLARNKPIAADVDFDTIGRSKACNHFSGADLAELMNEAASIAIDEKLLAGDNTNQVSFPIKASCFEQASQTISPSVSEKERIYYERLSQNFTLKESGRG